MRNVAIVEEAVSDIRVTAVALVPVPSSGHGGERNDLVVCLLEYGTLVNTSAASHATVRDSIDRLSLVRCPVRLSVQVSCLPSQEMAAV